MDSAGWPDDFASFEDFLKAQGLSCKYRGEVPQYREKLAEYRNDRIAVRVLSERGVWFSEVADLHRPRDWYDADLIRNLLNGEDGHHLPIGAQIDVFRENWSAILECFAPERQEDTHKKLDALRTARARRMFPGLLE